MKKLSLFVAAVLLSATVPSVAQSNYNQDEVVKIDRHNHSAFREGEVLVKFKAGSGIVQSGARSINASGVNRVLSSLGVTELEQLMPLTGEEVQPVTRSFSGKHINDIDLSTLYRVRFDTAKVPSVQEAIDNMKKLSEVEFAEPNYLVYALSDGTDDGVTYDTAEEATAYMAEPLYSEQWGIPAINLPALWKQPKITTKRPVIAILDTGVDITHPDLVDNIWTNTLEAEGEEEADDDNNGFADDLHGWDFVNQTGRIGDWNGHGTHCAGIAAAVGNNGIGITGANPDALIMPITIMQSDGTGDVATIIKGIDYAVANGADVLSMSFGGYAYSLAEEQALAKAYNKAVLVAAAGNDGHDIWGHHCMRDKPAFPAAFAFVLGVEASANDNGSLAVFSNFDFNGPIFSDFNEEQLYNYELRAPGVNIMSTYPDGRYKELNGTSMACPLVAGAISRYMQSREIINKEALSGDLIHTLNGNLDINAAFEIKDEDRKPEFSLVTYTLKDTIEGDSDGRPDAGETIAFYPTLRNVWGQANNIKFSLEIGENEETTVVEILDENVDFGKPLSSYSKNASANPLRFKVNKDCVDGRHIRLVLRVTCDDAGEFAQEFTITVENGVEIGGMITENMTLYPDVHYIVTRPLAVPEGVTLTIKPGTVLRFKDGMGMSINGNLECKGTPDSLIVFTKTELGYGYMEDINVKNDTLCYVKFCNLNFRYYPLVDLTANLENCLIRDCVLNTYGVGSFRRVNIISCDQVSQSGNIPTDANIKEVNIIGNKWVNSAIGISFLNRHNLRNINVFNNLAKGGEVSHLLYNSSDPIVKSSRSFYFGSEKEPIVRWGIYDMQHPTNPIGFGMVDLSDMLTRPSIEAHGIVWKVLVNGYDAQDEFDLLPPLGVGKHKFEVYFSRPMDTAFTPMIAMGVRPPYTQNVIAEEGSWNEDRTIYTAYLTITGKTNTDGLNRICVADAVESHEDYYIRKELCQLAQKTDSLLQKVANVSEKVVLQQSGSYTEGNLSGYNCSNNLYYLSDGKYNQVITFDSNGYLQVDLDAYKNARLIRFNYHVGANDVPDIIVVQGSNDGITFNDVSIVSSFDEINPLPMADIIGNTWNSFLIDAKTFYRYYRFVFSQNEKSGIFEFGIDVLNPIIKDNYISLLTGDEAIEIYKNIVSADILCDNEHRDCNLLQTTLDQMYADHNKLAEILGEPTIEQVPIEVPSTPDWVIPIENVRFNVEVAAAGSMATGLMAEAGLGKVTLTWETDEEDFEDLLGYNIYRYTVDTLGVSSDSIVINQSVIDSEETSYTDYDVVPGTTYYYVIKQLTTSLSSHALSNAVAATPLTAQKGDANGSLAVDVADVVTEIAYMTNQDPQPFIFEAADVNSDLAVNILDVVGTLNIILTPSTASIASVNNTATYTVEDGILYVESPVALGGVQVRIAAPKGTEFTALEGLNGFEQTGNWQSDEEYLFLAYSMVGRTIGAGKQALLRIGDATISQVVLSDARGTNVLAINGNATGIGAVEGMQMTLPYPNPFSTQLTIPYIIGKEGNHQVNIIVSDLAGRAIHQHGETNGFGEYTYTWTPSGNLANGLYLVSLYVDGTLMHTSKVVKD